MYSLLCSAVCVMHDVYEVVYTVFNTLIIHTYIHVYKQCMYMHGPQSVVGERLVLYLADAVVISFQ